jgi:hypothetical protein
MKAKTVKRVQKILWHFRWMLLTGLMVYNLYSFIVSFKLSSFLPVHGFIFALYFFLGLLEDYLECKISCKI